MKAQEYDCNESYIIFNDALRTKDYKRAYQFWQSLVGGTCDAKIKEKSTIITNGGAVLGKMIKASEGEQQKARIDSLYFNYNKGMEVLGRKPALVEDLGASYARYEGKEKPQETFDLLNESIGALNEKSSPSSVRYFYTACFYLYQQQQIDKGEMVTQYLRLDPICDKAMAAAAGKKKKVDAWKSTKEFLFSVAKNFLTCDVITEVYQPKVDADPTNKELLKEVFGLMDDAKCENNDVSVDFYLSVLDKMLAIEPSAEGYYGKGKIELAKNKKDAAATSFEKAYALCTDSCEIKLDIIKAGTNCSSKWYGIWMDADPTAGEPWLHKADQAANQVTNTSIDPNLTKRKLANAKAIEYCEKAKSVDPGIASKANSMIERYKALLPACDELFQLSISKGDQISLGSLGTVTVMCQ